MQPKKRVSEAFESSGCSGKLAEPTLVEVQLRFGEQVGLRRQFERELRMGAVLEEGGATVYRAHVNDPVELLPLLRAYAPWIRILPGEHDLDARLRADLQNMRTNLYAYERTTE